MEACWTEGGSKRVGILDVVERESLRGADGKNGRKSALAVGSSIAGGNVPGVRSEPLA